MYGIIKNKYNYNEVHFHYDFSQSYAVFTVGL